MQKVEEGMKRTRILAYALLAATAVLAGSAVAGIQGTKHDFTSTGDMNGKAYNKTTDMCGPCHVPHKPKQNVPLWAHTLTTKTFELYSSNPEYTGGHAASYDASPVNFEGSRTRACLSCHDGTVAVVTGLTLSSADSSWMLYSNGSAVPASASPQNGLMGTHPVGVTYSPTWAGFKDISTDASVKLENGKVQCTSCHAPHDNSNSFFLVKSDDGSALCMTCHDK